MDSSNVKAKTQDIKTIVCSSSHSFPTMPCVSDSCTWIPNPTKFPNPEEAARMKGSNTSVGLGVFVRMGSFSGIYVFICTLKSFLKN
jgi:hypothetical protein